MSRSHPPSLGARRAFVGWTLVLGLCFSPAARAQSVPDPDPWWGPDKALHFTFSAAIAGAGYGATAAFSEDRAVRLLVGGGVSLLAGTAKELLDLAGLGQPSWRDFTWDVIGCATGLVVALLLDVFVISPLLRPAASHPP
jgi:putative lipoprotein